MVIKICILHLVYAVNICETIVHPPAGGQSLAEIDTDKRGWRWDPEYRAAGAVERDDHTAASYCGGSGQWDSAARQSH